MHKLPGIEVNTGSLGHGLNLACGMALALRQDKKKSRVFALMGDGELAEGSNWEAAAIAAQYKLDNLCVIVDANGLQISGHTKDVMSYEPITDHFAGFGWAVTEIDGNNMEEVVATFDKLPLESGKPNLIVAHDIKAKGFSELEDQVGCHYWAPDQEAMARAEKELEDAIKEVLAQ